MSGLPSEFWGVWERVELTVADRLVPSGGRAFWIQASSRFVDVRAAGGGLVSEAFAGTTTWNPVSGVLSWAHDIDMYSGGHDDAGRVEWADGDLVEHGSAPQFGDTIDYTEVWRRRSMPGDQVVIADRVDGPGALAWNAHLGVVTIDDRPNGALRGGIFERRSWGCAFVVTHGPPLATRPPALAEEEFTAWDSAWQVVDRATCGTVGRPPGMVRPKRTNSSHLEVRTRGTRR